MKKSLLLATLPILSIAPLAVSCNKGVKKYDVVDQCKLNISDELFNEVMKKKDNTDFDDANYLDFARDGIERMLTTSDFPVGGSNKVFTNYVDGDTTQFTSYNGLYTVKVRYLSVDTPESTSEIEKWGKAASNFNKKTLKAAKHVLIQSAACAKTGQKIKADLDGYGRSLAYVWYSNEINPTKDDFRNLNLELVYEGYSLNNSQEEKMVDLNNPIKDKHNKTFFDYFWDAGQIAQKNEKYIYSSDDTVDPLFYDKVATTIELKDIYEKSNDHPFTSEHVNQLGEKDTDDTNYYSSCCDNYTRWRFEKVTVSARVGTGAFYVQKTYNKGQSDERTYGLYVFSNNKYDCVEVGNVINITGVLEWYGGSYELAGVHFSRFFEDEKKWDMEYCLDNSGNRITETITPKEITPEEMVKKDTGHEWSPFSKYECNFVKLVGSHDNTVSDNSIYFNNTVHLYDDKPSQFASGGSEEIDSYNTAHPKYNTNNKMILFGTFGKDTPNMSGNNLPGDNDSSTIRVVINDGVSISYQDPEFPTNPDAKKSVLSYRYFTGTKYPKITLNDQGKKELSDSEYEEKYAYYSKEYPEVVYDLEQGNKFYEETAGMTDADKAKVIDADVKKAITRVSYKRKKITDVSGVVQRYVSVSGATTKTTLNICNQEGLGTVTDLTDYTVAPVAP